MARDLGLEKKKEFYRAQVGHRVTVLVERVSEEREGCVRGYSENYVPVTLPGSTALINRAVRVRIHQWTGGRLWGYRIEGQEP